MTKYYIPMPTTKVEKVDVPFSSGSIDISEITGEPQYNDRTGLSFEFLYYDGDYSRWVAMIQRLALHLHGKKLKMIPDNDKSYYYMVRLEIDPQKTKQISSKVVLTGTAEPFKYEMVASNQPWEWDTLDFVNGVIQEDMSNVTVTGSKTVTIRAGGVPTCPEFYVSSITGSLKVTINNVDYKFNKGIGLYRFPALKIGDEDTSLVFTGTGNISISYRGRHL